MTLFKDSCKTQIIVPREMEPIRLRQNPTTELACWSDWGLFHLSKPCFLCKSEGGMGSINFEGQFKMQMWGPLFKIKNFKMVMAEC